MALRPAHIAALSLLTAGAIVIAISAHGARARAPSLPVVPTHITPDAPTPPADSSGETTDRRK